MTPASSLTNTVGIQIRVIKDDNNSLHDEVYTIRSGDHHDFTIVNRSPFSGTETTMYLKNACMVLRYVRDIFELLSVDSERFSFVQFDASCYPVVMVSRREVLRGDAVDRFLRVVENVLTNWPSTCTEVST
jgi:hypothetical protein